MRYLLDTTLIIDHAHGYGPAMALLHKLYEDGAELFTCDVVVCEALSGGSDEHLAVVSRLLEPLDYVVTDPAAARLAADARLRRHRSGGKLGLGNALIAAAAAGLGATIVTRNRPDFERQGASVLGY
ncbi:MAG: type II toxin-antitoxin system VapC family toxin [Chloroflexi bacterium]|nr:type II toxin-antitoxin system VapC family toxin [Chloroflexota bacterium]